MCVSLLISFKKISRENSYCVGTFVSNIERFNTHVSKQLLDANDKSVLYPEIQVQNQRRFAISFFTSFILSIQKTTKDTF